MLQTALDPRIAARLTHDVRSPHAPTSHRRGRRQPRLLGQRRPPAVARHGRDGRAARSSCSSCWSACSRRWVAPADPYKAIDDPPLADRLSRLSARHRRTRPRHALAPDLRRPAVAVHGRHAGRCCAFVHRRPASASSRAMSAAGVNTSIMRTIDVFFAFPSVLLAIAISGALGAGIVNSIVSLTHRLHAADRARRRKRDDAGAHSRLSSRRRAPPARGAFTIVRVHVLGNVLGPIFVYATSLISVSMILASGLSFLGLGVQAARARMGPDAEHAAHGDLQPADGRGAARRDDLHHLDLASTCSPTACARPWTSRQ